MSFLNNSGNTEIFLKIIQCWRACAIKNEPDQAPPMVIHQVSLMYPYYSRLVFFPIKHNSVEDQTNKEYFSVYLILLQIFIIYTSRKMVV